jgi:hypothetical protein
MTGMAIENNIENNVLKKGGNNVLLNIFRIVSEKIAAGLHNKWLRGR